MHGMSSVSKIFLGSAVFAYDHDDELSQGYHEVSCIKQDGSFPTHSQWLADDACHKL
jgi:hypothetical protein